MSRLRFFGENDLSVTAAAAQASSTPGMAAPKPHAVSQAGSNTCTYDCNGNLTQRVEGSTTYAQGWDAENRLTTVTVNGQTTTFYYDGDGVRVKKVQNGQTTVYIGALYEKNVSTGVVTTYYFAGSTRVAMRQGGVLYYLHGDHLGSTSLTTDSSGNKIGEVKYYPYGETRYTWGSTPTDRRFTGQRSEEASLGSLYDFNARMYSPAIGRFISADGIVPEPGNPQAFNRYSYVSNNPVNRTDPSGHKECEKSTDAGTCQGATQEERRRAQACANIPGWCDPNTSGASELLELLGSMLFEPLDWAISIGDCLGGDCSGVLLGLVPLVPGSARKLFNAVEGGADAARALENAGDAARQLDDLPDDALVYQYQRNKPKPGKEPTFSNVPREGETAISCQFGPACGNNPRQGLTQAFGREPLPGEYYRQTTIDQIRSVRTPDYDAGRIVDGRKMPPGHLSVYGNSYPDRFDAIWSDPIPFD